MLDVVLWKWRSNNYRSRFTAHHVNVAARMIWRNYDNPVRVNCITDDGDGIDKRVRVIPLWDEFKHIRNPSFSSGPSCYRRLKAYSPEFAQIVGPRFVSMDLDLVICGDMTPVWDRDEDFVIWGDVLLQQKPGVPAYNGSMWMMTAGARRQVWDRFDPLFSPCKAHENGCKGSDQGWVTYVLGKGEKMWTTADGVYSYRMHLKKNQLIVPPDGAKVVFFHGIAWDDPNGPGSAVRDLKFVKDNYN